MNTFERLAQLRDLLDTWKGAADCRILSNSRRARGTSRKSTFPHDDYHTSKGTGATFDNAWDNMRHLWILSTHTLRANFRSGRIDLGCRNPPHFHADKMQVGLLCAVDGWCLCATSMH